MTRTGEKVRGLQLDRMRNTMNNSFSCTLKLKPCCNLSETIPTTFNMTAPNFSSILFQICLLILQTLDFLLKSTDP